MKYKEIAKKIIVSYFNEILFKYEVPNIEALNEKNLIQSDDKVLLEHIKAIKKIFTEAEKEMKNSGFNGEK